MDLGNPAALFSGLFLGVVGTGLLVYGKRAGRPVYLAAGFAFSAAPLVFHSVVALWLAGAACAAGLYAAGRGD